MRYFLVNINSNIHLPYAFPHLSVTSGFTRLTIAQANFLINPLCSSNRIMGQFHKVLPDGEGFQARQRPVARVLHVRGHNVRRRRREQA